MKNDPINKFFLKFFAKNFVSSRKVTNFVPANERQPLAIAKIAQLVEHDLAKVGVAGSSPVFRSQDVQVAELVDALL